MRRLYLIVPNPHLTHEVVRELLSQGAGPEQVWVHAKRPDRFSDAGIAASRLPSGRDQRVVPALTGAILALVAALLILAVTGAGPWSAVFVLVATLGGAAVGATSGGPGGTQAGPGKAPQVVSALRRRLGRDDAVVVADVPDARLGEIQRDLKARHPEVRVQGTDPQGTPPFP
jgi:hypothetical protein